jgi:predicted PurR-regulated permease PerM
MRSPSQGTFSGVLATWIVAVAAALFLLRSASQLLIPITIAILISYVLDPIVRWLADRGVPRLAGASLLMCAVLGLGAFCLFTLRDDAAAAVRALPQAAQRAREMIESLSGTSALASVQQTVDELRGLWSGTFDRASSGTSEDEARGGDGESMPSGAQSSPAPTSSQLSTQPGNARPGLTAGVTSAIQRGVGSVLALAGNLTVVFFLVFFLLLSGNHLRTRTLEIAGDDAGRRRQLAKIIDDINRQIQRFLVVRLITAVVVACATGVALALMGVQYAVVWGIAAGLFNSIPYFGPIIVSGGLFLVGLVQGGGMTQALQIAGIALVITTLEGWLITPPLLGKAEGMSALAVFLGLLLWTWIWGAWGTILAVPMLVILKAVADHTPALKPLGRLMAP